jgi:hypothetical protein
MRESVIEKKVGDYATSKGWLVYKFSSPNTRAVPDKIFMRDGVVFFIEFKAPNKLPTKLQYANHKRITEHGVSVFVIDNIEKGIALVDSQ